MANISGTVVQDELRKLAKEISVQVLTHQPEDIYKFTADYLNVQLNKRERKDAEIFIRDLIEHDLTYEAMLKRRGISMEAAHKASSIMQAAVRRFLGKQKVKREIEKIEIGKVKDATGPIPPSNDQRTTAALLLQRKFRTKIGILKKENPAGDAGPANRFRPLSQARQRSMNPGTSEGDVMRFGGAMLLVPLAAAQNMSIILDNVDVDDPRVVLQTTQETSEIDETRSFAESMVVDLISGIFTNENSLFEASFNRDMDCFKLADEITKN